MTYKVLGHTADIRLSAEGKNMPELFKAALQGTMKILDPEENITGGEAIRRVEMDSPDRTALLIDFLNEVLFYAQKYREYYTEAAFKDISDTHLKVDLKGKSAKFFHKDIKAATYHEAQIKKNPKDNLETIIIFDI